MVIRKVYEDNATGRLSNERFDQFFSVYDTEQARLKVRITELTDLIAAENEKGASVSRFLGLVKKYTDVSELTAEIVRVFIDRIVIHQADKSRHGEKRQQRIDIFYNFIGLLKE